ncbi:hypothetical protein MKW98_012734, partial [Papaver atlanticum]
DLFIRNLQSVGLNAGSLRDLLELVRVDHAPLDEVILEDIRSEEPLLVIRTKAWFLRSSLHVRYLITTIEAAGVVVVEITRGITGYHFVTGGCPAAGTPIFSYSTPELQFCCILLYTGIRVGADEAVVAVKGDDSLHKSCWQIMPGINCMKKRKKFK